MRGRDYVYIDTIFEEVTLGKTIHKSIDLDLHMADAHWAASIR